MHGPNRYNLTKVYLISDLKKKNPHWDRKSVDDHDSTSRAIFTEKILSVDGEC